MYVVGYVGLMWSPFLIMHPLTKISKINKLAEMLCRFPYVGYGRKEKGE